MPSWFTILQQGPYYFAQRGGGIPVRIGKRQGHGFRHFGLLKITPALATPSELPYLLAVSQEEGAGFDGVNTWHPGDCSFGNFQWNHRSGGYGAFLKRLRDRDHGCFEACFGRFGFDLVFDRGQHWLSFEGRLIGRDDALLRTDQFAALACHAAREAEYQKAEIEQVRLRLERALASSPVTVASSVGKALLLSTHLLSPNRLFKETAQYAHHFTARTGSSEPNEPRYLEAWVRHFVRAGYRKKVENILLFFVKSHADTLAKHLLGACANVPPLRAEILQAAPRMTAAALARPFRR